MSEEQPAAPVWYSAEEARAWESGYERARERLVVAERERDQWKLRAHAVITEAEGARRERDRLAEALRTMVSHVDGFHDDKHGMGVGTMGDCSWSLCEAADEKRAVLAECAGTPTEGATNDASD